ncbi:MAG: glycoside hydrolase family 25 protein [Chitinophagaceae bacterium]
MKALFVVAFCLLAFTSFTQTEFNQPWKDTSRAIILDPFAGNSINWDKVVTDKRVTAIIHKATQGARKDAEYKNRRTIAKQKGLLWGSYHLGMAGDPVVQADFYLSVIGNDPSELMALDLESLESQFMSLNNAVKFINRVHEKTGRFPLVYCNHAVFTAIQARFDSTSVFGKCGLWYARFKKDITGFTSRKTWLTYTIWQFSCEVNCSVTGQCLYNVPGTRFDMDINVYNGTVDELRNKWPAIR